MNWGSVADWASAAASFAASVTALYLARAADRVKLRGTWGLREAVGDGRLGPELLNIHVTNTGRRPAKVTTTAMRWGFLKRHYGLIVNWDGAFSNLLPIILEDGAQAQWSIPFDRADPNRWFRDEMFKESVPTWLDVQAVRAVVYTSSGARLVLKPEKALLKRLHVARAEKIASASGRT